MTMFVVTSAFTAFLLVITCVDAQLKVRLVDGTAPWNGRLEMLYNGTWGKVCGYKFRKQETQVVCRMMGFNTSQGFTMSAEYRYGIYRYRYGSYYIYLQDLRCTGEETSLEHCSEIYTDSYCLYLVGITCNTQHTRLRLRDIHYMEPNIGRLQINIGDGHWMTQCVSSNITASVVCRQLGLPSRPAMLGEIPVDRFYGFNRLTYISLLCLGNETSIFECQHEINRHIDCQDYNIICSNSPVTIHTTSSTYPLMEETKATLKCSSNKESGVIKYTWPEIAGGFPDGSSLIITRVTREHHGSRVRCEAMYSDGEVVSSDTLQLQVYCEYWDPTTMNETTVIDSM
ncbi:deleted in malignant brain tumors 1 protein-like [Pomacea canaliculata]|uniref:deleted in malignant brain tumors 1 protein-like n=1 Tax=Pomacea canaliculata TaxID=400727 RepID=UPI000D730CC9|nr:deleted in malignant brain tumors 1 protein-like [Pomacea canaliculata]